MNKWLNPETNPPKNEGVYIVDINGFVTCAYYLNNTFYELSFNQSPDFIKVDFYQNLPESEQNKES